MSSVLLYYCIYIHWGSTTPMSQIKPKSIVSVYALQMQEDLSPPQRLAETLSVSPYMCCRTRRALHSWMRMSFNDHPNPNPKPFIGGGGASFLSRCDTKWTNISLC